MRETICLVIFFPRDVGYGKFLELSKDRLNKVQICQQVVLPIFIFLEDLVDEDPKDASMEIDT